MAANEPLHYFEVWRSPWGMGTGLTINPTDGSLWACMGDSVFHYDANHTLLSKTELVVAADAVREPERRLLLGDGVGAGVSAITQNASLIQLALGRDSAPATPGILQLQTFPPAPGRTARCGCTTGA